MSGRDLEEKEQLYHEYSIGFHGLWLSHFQRVSLIHVVVVSLYLMGAVAREPGPLSPEEFDLIPLTNTNTGTINFGHFTKQKTKPRVAAQLVLAVQA